MSAIDKIKTELRKNPRAWLVTGAAGFIGSGLLEELLMLGQSVVGLDNFSTGYEHNLQDVRKMVEPGAWSNFRFIEGDIRRLDDCRKVCEDVDYVLHQAALGSVPRSIDDPVGTNESNIDGFLNMLVAARDAKVKRFVYAASSSTYGDHPGLPKKEDMIGKPLSPYAVTKYVNELYADIFARAYGMNCVGLRYFNVFGKRQDPKGAYAAVIPRWIGALLDLDVPVIFGDGETSRDFCYIANIVQANILSACTDNADALNEVYNVANGDRTSLNDLFYMIREPLTAYDERISNMKPEYGPFRPGDVRHSQADIAKARGLLSYDPTHSVRQGMRETVSWYMNKKRND